MISEALKAPNDREQFNKNWDLAFGKTKKVSEGGNADAPPSKPTGSLDYEVADQQKSKRSDSMWKNKYLLFAKLVIVLYKIKTKNRTYGLKNFEQIIVIRACRLIGMSKEEIISDGWISQELFDERCKEGFNFQTKHVKL